MKNNRRDDTKYPRGNQRDGDKDATSVSTYNQCRMCCYGHEQ